ncbi:permease [Streptomyces nanshensis]|uniref:permease n=1 Tax=Streptomyces nanshensis TaxID=518642 RepID=UPI00099FB0D6
MRRASETVDGSPEGGVPDGDAAESRLPSPRPGTREGAGRWPRLGSLTWTGLLPRPRNALLLGAAALSAAVIVVAGGLAGWTDALTHPGFGAWQTVSVAIVVQALPFLLFGTMLAGAINAFVPAQALAKALPARPALAVPVAGAAGVVLPGCECASVPVAGSLIRRGVTSAAALTFLLAAPAVNPIVLAATAVAFPGRPEMMWARLLASLGASVGMGWLWLRFGREEWLRLPSRTSGHHAGRSRWEEFRQSFQHDLLHAGGFLVVGALAAATFNVLVPRSVLDTFSASPWMSVLFLALLAIVLSICSEADAFVAASLTGFSPTARLAFMVVGPMVDLKLIALQAGTFGRAFALRFSAATLVMALLSSALIGWWLL